MSLVSQEILRVNVLGSVYLTQAMLPIMMERREGKIVFISSMAGQVQLCDTCAAAITLIQASSLTTAWTIRLHCLCCLKVCPEGVGRDPADGGEALQHCSQHLLPS